MAAFLFHFLLAGCLFLAAPCFADESVRASDLAYLTGDLPPLSYTVNDKPSGLAVAVLKLMWRRMGEKEHAIAFVPWVRAYDTAREEPRTVIFSTYRTAEREPQFRWVGPIAEGELMVYTLRTRQVAAKSIKDLSAYRVAGLRDTAETLKLERAGIPVTLASRLENAFKMLDSSRIDGVATDRYRFKATLKNMGRSPDEFAELWDLGRDSLYFAFSKDIPPELVQRFQEALDGVRKSPEYKNLLNYYGN